MTAGLFQGDKEVGRFEVKGRQTDSNDLVKKIVDETEKKVSE